MNWLLLNSLTDLRASTAKIKQEDCNRVYGISFSSIQLAWSKKIHCTVLYKVLTLHYEESLKKLSVEITDDFSDGTIEPQKIDSRDALSSILPPVGLSLYFNVVQQCDWFHIFTEVRLFCNLYFSYLIQ